MSKQEMNNDNNITPLMEQEFAIVDSIITAHTNAAIAKVNAEALQTYWEVGAYISDRLKNAQWGDHVVSELADYLKRHNPKRRGYSKRNLYNMVTFYDNYSSSKFQAVTEQLKLSEFVQTQTAQIEARPIVQMSSAQNGRCGLLPFDKLRTSSLSIDSTTARRDKKRAIQLCKIQ